MIAVAALVTVDDPEAFAESIAIACGGRARAIDLMQSAIEVLYGIRADEARVRAQALAIDARSGR